MIRLIIGGIGAGKTCLMTALAYKKWAEGHTIYSNYRLKFPFKDVRFMRDLNEVGDGKNYMCLDELWKTIDSRRSGSLANMLGSSAILQSRKKHLDVDATAQFFGSVDIRFRGLVNKVYLPRIVKTATDAKGKVYPLLLKVEEAAPVSFDQIGYPYRSFYVKLLYEKFYIPDLYDTFEVVEGVQSGQNEYLNEVIERYINAPYAKVTYLKNHIERNERNSGRTIKPGEASYCATSIITIRQGQDDSSDLPDEFPQGY